MATNFEFYKEYILQHVDEFKCLPAVVNGKAEKCGVSNCEKCDFRGSEYCFFEKIKWLYAEQQPKLTKRERAFCEAVQTGWIARDEDGDLYWYGNIPIKYDVNWGARTYVKISYINLDFSFIKWEDEKPWAVEDLLKLEVMEAHHETD